MEQQRVVAEDGDGDEQVELVVVDATTVVGRKWEQIVEFLGHIAVELVFVVVAVAGLVVELVVASGIEVGVGVKRDEVEDSWGYGEEQR